MLMVAVVAIIVVGPKDLPGMLRTVGRSIKKMRGMAGDFQRQFDDALKEAELDGVKKSFDDVKSMNPMKGVTDSLNPLKDAARDIEKDINDDGESDPGQVDDEDYSSFDPGTLFDESKLAKVAEPVKVDVEAALAKEKAKTTAKAKPARKKAATAKSKSTAKTAASKATGQKSKTAAKPAKARAPARKPAAKPATASKATSKPATKSAASKKPAAKSTARPAKAKAT